MNRKTTSKKTPPKSWKTTVAGWAALVAAIAFAVVALLDGDASTKVDPSSIMHALAALGVAIPTWLGLLAAKDNDKPKK